MHTQCPDKDRQILIRAYMAKLLFPSGMTQFDYDNMLNTTKGELRSATDAICEDQDKARLAFSQFYNAFTKRSPAEMVKHNVTNSMPELTEGPVRELPLHQLTQQKSLFPVPEEPEEEAIADLAVRFQSVS